MSSPTLHPPSADRNLLFGILALQAGLIGKDAFLRAMDTWSSAKGRPLGEILLEQGSLDRGAQALVEALVKKNLEMHDGDVELSLAALSTIDTAREQLSPRGDPSLGASLPPVSTRREADASPDLAVGSSTSSGLRFHIVRHHAKGGLGQVAVAIDQELHREVALKEIQDRYADIPDFRTRFLREAEITGGLEHPGIVPVYGLGQYADGRPYYAMRFVKGETLQSAVERFHKSTFATPGQALLELRSLLGRFIHVCNAVAYAHSRGVIHRDIKPQNIMLGPYGETLLVDWGLAKPTDRADEPTPSAEMLLRPQRGDSTPTRMGDRVGTPAYMSPEQCRGDWARVGPASDVYSLGATLFTVLTGRPPFVGEQGDLFENVERGRFAPPRLLKPALPRALESICLKAMALKPEDRYLSPRELADDLEHWLADEPVASHRETSLARLGRWGRRHRPLVSGGAALLLTAVVALAVGLVLLGREQLQTEHERDRANANERTASEQRDLALGTLKDVVFNIDAELRSRPNMQDLRQRLLSKAQEGLRQIAQSTVATAEANHGRIWSHFAIGDIYLVLGQTENANAQFEEAHRIAKALADADGQDLDAQHDLAVSHQKLAQVSMRLGQGEAARQFHAKALEITEAWANARPNDKDAQNELTFAYLRFAEATLQSGDAPAAHTAIGKALLAYQRSVGGAEVPFEFGAKGLTIRPGAAGFKPEEARRALKLGAEFLDSWELVVRAEPRNLESHRNLAVAFEQLALLVMTTGEVLKASSKALALREFVAQQDPTNVEDQARLVSAYRSFGYASLDVGHTPAAREAHETAFKVQQALHRSNPKDKGATRMLGIVHLDQSRMAFRRGDLAAAQELARTSVEMAEALTKDTQKKDAPAQRTLETAYEGLGIVHMRLGNFAAAKQMYDKNFAIAQALARGIFPSETDRWNLATGYGHLGEFDLEQGQAAAAIESFKQAHEIWTALTKTFPLDAEYQAELVQATYQLGDALLDSGNLDSAEETYCDALERAENLTLSDPDNESVRTHLVACRVKLGDARLRASRLPEARDLYANALETAEAIAKADSEYALFQRELGVCYRKVGEVRRELGETSAAREALRKSLELAENLSKRAPLDVWVRHDQAESCHQLGLLEARAGNDKEAAAWRSRALGLLRSLQNEGKLSRRHRYVSVLDALEELDKGMGKK
jgi:serine/threonine-protein kinase